MTCRRQVCFIKESPDAIIVQMWKKSLMRKRGIEPRAVAWEATMLPLHHLRVLRCCDIGIFCNKETHARANLLLLTLNFTRLIWTETETTVTVAA